MPPDQIPSDPTPPLTKDEIEASALRIMLLAGSHTYSALSTVSPDESRTAVIFHLLQRCRREGHAIFQRRCTTIGGSVVEWTLTRSGRDHTLALLRANQPH